MPPAIYPTKLFLTNTDNMNTENRVSPQAPEIEEAIIGACLIEQGAIPLVADKLRPEMFYVLRHQVIYAAILVCIMQE